MCTCNMMKQPHLWFTHRTFRLRMAIYIGCLFLFATVGVPSRTCSRHFSSRPAMGRSLHPRGIYVNNFMKFLVFHWYCGGKYKTTDV
jgi:hypothetical protein